MSGKRPTTEWQKLLRENRSNPSDSHLSKIARYLARRKAEEDFEESLLAQQRRKKLLESRHQPDDQ
jgi:hypothetical protein